MISTGNKELDEKIGGYGKEVTLIYGAGATGKTTLSILVACGQLKKDKKIVFLDTESGFSIDRFMQICGAGYITMLDRMLLLKAKNFEEQCRQVEKIMGLVGVDLIIVDSLGFHYRKEIVDNVKEINKKMDRQLKILTEISRRGVPVLLTNQVSTNPNDGEIKLVGGEMVKKWGKRLIELKKEPGKIILKKPEEREVKFKFVNEGIRLLE